MSSRFMNLNTIPVHPVSTNKLIRATLCLTMLLATAVAVHAGANEVTDDGRPIKWDAQTPITYLVNPEGIPGYTTDLQKSLIFGAIADAFRAWSSIPATSIHFVDGGATQLTGFNQDLTNVISFQPSNVSFPPGVLAITNTVFSSTTGIVALPNGRQITIQFPGQIVDADIAFNPAFAFSSNGATKADLVSILEHEIGHMLGLDHTGVLSSIMNPFGESGDASASRNLQHDDVAGVSALYPAATFAADSGTISGTVTSSGGASVKSADIVAITVPGGEPAASALSGSDGTFRIAGLRPGSYQVMVEPLDGPIDLSNFPGFFSSGQANFASTFFGGVATPSTISVAAGQSANANVVVSTAAADLPNVLRMAASLQSQTGGTLSFSSAPLYLPRGNAYQITVLGNNLTSDTSIRMSSPDIVPQGGTTGGTLGSGQVVRQQNISIGASAALAPSNLTLNSSSTGVSVMPGGIVVAPNASIADIFNAASSGTTTGRRLAPGTLFTLYGADVAYKADNWLGAVPVPTLPVGAAAPTNLGGISVKLDNQYVPLFFTCPGPQSCGQFQQINGLIPFEAAAGSHKMSIVLGPGAASADFSVTLAASAPGLFSTDSSGNGQGAILNGADNTVASPAGTFPGSHAAAPGSVVVIYASGLGPVTPALPTGVGSGANGTAFPQLARLPQLSIGGVSVPVGNFQFYGLSPTYVGLYQLNVVVPAGIQPGNAVPVVLTTAEGQASNAVTMAISQ